MELNSQIRSRLKCETWIGAFLRVLRRKLSKLKGWLFRLLVLPRAHSGLAIGKNISLRNGKAFRIGSNVKIGDHCRFESFSEMSKEDSAGEITIGDNVHFGDGVHIGALSGVVVGDNVLAGSNILIIDHNHGHFPRDIRDPDVAPKDRILISKGPIIIGENVWICDGVIILGGSIISAGSIVPAGTIVNGKWDN